MFRLVLGVALLVALCCFLTGGITINGKHHQVSCDCDKGVGVE